MLERDTTYKKEKQTEKASKRDMHSLQLCYNAVLSLQNRIPGYSRSCRCITNRAGKLAHFVSFVMIHRTIVC